MSSAPGLTAAIPPSAVLFDMDGLLIDTEPVWFDIETSVITGLGGHWAEDDQANLVGSSLRYASTIMAERVGGGITPGEIADQLLCGMEQRLASGVALQPGAAELVAELDAAGVPRALVSSSYRRLVDAALSSLPFSFAVSVAGDEVREGKPKPEPYLVAAARLRVDPVDSVALEDSPRGAASALAAGCVVVAVPSVVPIEPGPRQHVVTSLTKLDLPTLRALFPSGQ